MEKENKELKKQIEVMVEHIEFLKKLGSLIKERNQILGDCDCYPYGFYPNPPRIIHVPQYVYVPQTIVVPNYINLPLKCF